MKRFHPVTYAYSEFYHLVLKAFWFSVEVNREKVVVGICGAGTFWTLIKIMRNWKRQRDILRLRELKVAERKANFHDIRSRLTGRFEEYEEIISMPFKEIRFKLQSRKLKAKTVLEAFIHKSLELAEDLNCITEFLPDALAKAEKLDNMVAIQGPLHGVPFSVNDDIDLKGLLPSFSCSVNIPATNPSSESAVIVKILESHGAIPFCRTSTSIICMTYSARNPYFGEVHNPLNKNLSAGGSSCGCASLVRNGGAIFGIATDRAGGARVPAHFSGLTTLKASRHRISRRGCVQHCVGTTTVPCIMTKRVNDLITLYGLIMEKHQQHKSDAKVVPLPWNRQICSSKQKLRVGYFSSFPVSPAQGDIEEAVNKAKMYLQSCGHIVVNCEPPDDLKCQELWNGLTKVHEHRHFLQNESGAFESTENIEGRIRISPRVLWTDEARNVKKACSDQSIWKRLTEKLESIPGIKSSKDKAIERMHTTMNSDCDLWNTASLREQFVDEVLNNMNKLHVDVMLCPVFGSPAAAPELLTKMGLLPGVYSFIWNLLDLPAGTVKVWREGGRWLGGEFLESINSPLGVQIVGRPYQEELVLRVMNELDELNQELPPLSRKD